MRIRIPWVTLGVACSFYFCISKKTKCNILETILFYGKENGFNLPRETAGGVSSRPQTPQSTKGLPPLWNPSKLPYFLSFTLPLFYKKEPA